MNEKYHTLERIVLNITQIFVIFRKLQKTEMWKVHKMFTI